MTSTQLFLALLNSKKRENLDELKWPGENTFEVIVGAVLVQNTAWKNVEKALENLRAAGKLSLDGILSLKADELAGLIKPSGFYNTKAKRLLGLCAAIKREFKNFENFRQSVSRDAMVVDAYALRILGFLGYEFESYDEAAEWLGALNFGEIYEILGEGNFDEAEILKLYHALITEFCKENFKGKILSERGKQIFSELK